MGTTKKIIKGIFWFIKELARTALFAIPIIKRFKR